MSELKENLSTIQARLQPLFTTITPPKEGENNTPIVAMHEDFEVRSLKPLLDEYLDAPDRRKGTAVVNDMTSFIALTKRHQDNDSALFSKSQITENSVNGVITAVIDYHTIDHKPRFGGHKIQYNFPVSNLFKLWHEANGEKMEQAEFAQFLENNISDLREDDLLKDFPCKFGYQGVPKFATPAKMFELSRGLEINAQEKVRQSHRVQSGVSEIQYTCEHQDAAGEKIEVPEWFLLGIPMFEYGKFFKVPVRLRYRLHAGKVSWSFEMYRIQKIFDAAFGAACEEAQKETALPLYVGTPE